MLCLSKVHRAQNLQTACLGCNTLNDDKWTQVADFHILAHFSDNQFVAVGFPADSLIDSSYQHL